MSVSTLLRILALICFVLATFSVGYPPVTLVPLGLAFWVASTLP